MLRGRERRVASMRGKTHAGRISKTREDQILKENSSALVRHFQVYPLRPPIDGQFKAYYERFLEGDSGGILRYYEDNQREEDIAGSFYEFLGRLITIRFYKAANLLLSRVEGSNATRWPGATEAFDHWHQKLTPMCKRARQFIRHSRDAGINSRRESLWRAYVFQPLPTVRFAYLHGSDNEELLQGEENSRQQKVHHEVMQDLLAGKNTRDVDSVLPWIGDAGVQDRNVLKPTLRSLTLAEVNKFAKFGLIPREIFFDLAETKGNLGSRRFAFTPAQVARVFARRIVGISESALSHRSSRGK